MQKYLPASDLGVRCIEAAKALVPQASVSSGRVTAGATKLKQMLSFQVQSQPYAH
jgi:hypothetical protein